MRIAGTVEVGVALVVGLSAALSFDAVAQVSSADNRIVMMDNCLPGDPAWNPTGGCTQRPSLGDVSNEEFGRLLLSPLISGLVGHPSWRNEPSHITTTSRGGPVRVTNRGGRAHTLTRVAEFGGGSVPPFNVGMTRAPECPPTPDGVQDALAPGESTTLTGLEPGLNKFQCCFHPWMRATVRVN